MVKFMLPKKCVTDGPPGDDLKKLAKAVNAALAASAKKPGVQILLPIGSPPPLNSDFVNQPAAVGAADGNGG